MLKNEVNILRKVELLGQQFSVYGTPEEPLFLSKDVATMINHSDVSMMMRGVDDDEKLVQTMFVSGQNRDVWMLTEGGLYEVLMQSRKPIAKQFKKGVKSILKQIRQTGGYISTRPEDTPEVIMAKALQIAQKTIERHEQQVQMLMGQVEIQQEEIKALAPKAEYTDSVLQSTNTYTMTQVAKEFGYSAKTFAVKLKNCGILFRQSGQWMLTYKYQDKGLTKTRTHTFNKPDGTTGTNTITVWTEKGRMFLHEFREKHSKKKK